MSSRTPIRSLRWFLAGLSLAAAGHSPGVLAAPASPRQAALRPCPQGVPAALDPPAGVTLAAGFGASGVQIYACTAARPGEAPAWQLEAPHATLTAGGEVAGIHFAGPVWQGLDGSSVRGAKLAAADAPAPGAVPWLLLSGAGSGGGRFGNITHVQRLETAGGKAPSGGCDAGHLGQRALVPYTSSYFFYRPAVAGEPVVQCRSGAPRKGG